MVKSMNPDLVNPIQAYIGCLKAKINTLEATISKFKKYDNERKKYYKDLAIRVGNLESELAKYEDSEDPTGKLRKRIEAQRSTIRGLQAVLTIKNIDFPEDMDLVFAKKEIASLNAKVEKLTKSNKQLRNTISELCCKLNKNETN